MANKQMEPDLDRGHQRERRLHKGNRKEKARGAGMRVGAFAVVAAIGLVACFGPGDPPGGENATAPADEQTAATSEAEAVEVATAFVEAYGAFDIERAISYLADDADISGLGGTLEDLQLNASWFEAIGLPVPELVLSGRGGPFSTRRRTERRTEPKQARPSNLGGSSSVGPNSDAGTPGRMGNGIVMDEGHSGEESGASPMDYDAELRLLNKVLRRDYGIERYEHVLDIGCGAGQTTREAARMAAEGGAVGVDLSAEAIARARELARAEGVREVTFEQADAQVYLFPSRAFEVVISRFGTMFFLDPVAAFANIGWALTPDGRLVMMVWQGHDQNEWSLAIEEALGGARVVPASNAPDPFSLADPAKVEGILDAAGFPDVTFTDVHRPI